MGLGATWRGGGGAAAWLMLAACGAEPGPDRASFSVVDSAGVRIVDNAGPAWEGGEAWLVESEPTLALGELEGPDETRFFRIRDLAIRADGVILVADGGSQELRAFGPDGTFLWRQGGEGDGPGEYRSLSTLISRPGDSVAVYDSRSRRVTVVDPAGEVGRSFVPEVPGDRPMAAPRVEVTRERWVASGGVRFTGEGAGSETVAPPMTLLWVRPDGAALDVVAELPTPPRLVQRSGGSVGVWSVPFSAEAPVAGGNGRLVIGDPGEPRWTVRDTLGRIVQAVSFPGEPRPVTDADWTRAEESLVGEDLPPEQRRAIADAYREMERPSSWPFFQEILIDATDAVWVEEFQPPWAGAEPHRWWVFAADGRLLGEVSTPPGLDVRVITRDQVAGVHTDELGVERVRTHRIHRP